MRVSGSPFFRVLLFSLISGSLFASPAWAVPPTCPHNYYMSQDGTKCVAQQAPGCTQGKWDGTGCTVVTTVPPSCPAGLSYSADTKKCTALIEPSCPAGAHYNRGANQCISHSAPRCPSGTALDPNLDKCVSVQTPPCQSGTYDAAANKCVASAPASCPAGYTYVPAQKQCKTTQAPVCPSAGAWNSRDGVCNVYTPSQYPPACPSGWTLGSVSFMGQNIPVCEKTAAPTCPSGYMLKNGQCIKKTPTGTAV